MDALRGSQVDLSDFAVVDIGVDASGASTETVVAGGWPDVEATRASHVYCAGSPALGEIETSGASSVEGK
ncbi:MAG: hypothetical protein PVF54_09520 [Anaerolineae bacterium]|jgi:hypothetical protein